jgi:hypothetical protein
MSELSVSDELTVAIVDGVRVVLTRAAIDHDSLQLEWDGVRSDNTDRMDEEWALDMADWLEATRANGRDEVGMPPRMPGNLLARVLVTVTDDSGNQINQLDGQAAGTGTEWHSEWRFARPPTGARGLILQFDVDGVSTGRCELRIN